jgi:hypothetical protein
MAMHETANGRHDPHESSNFNPLIYYCVYGDHSYYDCLCISLASLQEFGNFHGTLGIACDRRPDQIMDCIPDRLRTNLIFSAASAERSWFNRYYLEHGLYDAYQPILYCDVDVVFDADVTNMLIDILLRPKVCCATENASIPGLADKPTRLWTENVSNYFGRDLYEGDPDFQDVRVALGNSGIIGVDNPARLQAVSLLVKEIAASRSAEQLQVFTDQPILDYVLHKTGEGDFTLLDRYCRLTHDLQSLPIATRRGLAHFHPPAPASAKLPIMKAYLDALARDRDAGPKRAGGWDVVDTGL